jgi:hypothetical protein
VYTLFQVHQGMFLEYTSRSETIAVLSCIAEQEFQIRMTYFDLNQVQVRIQRAKAESFRVVKKEVKADKVKYKIASASGATYIVNICSKPKCS